jgi:WD40 repeat protein/tRNA A-37 threonylcarbamoyl transferase component Bud32
VNDAEEHLMTVFTAALERGSAAERQAYLDRTCADDAPLRQRVEALLRAHDRAGGFLGHEHARAHGHKASDLRVEPGELPLSFPSDAHAAAGANDASPKGSQRVAPVIPGYEIAGELGRGGMGVVYKARQTRLNRPVALKMILAGAHAGAEATARFLAEAEAVAQLQHPNIVQIFHIDEHAGHPYFEMEFVGGGSLAERLDGTPRPLREAARLTEILACAMAEAHRRGIVHRDLKPGNILLTPEGAPKVADFGLAKLLNADSGLTRTDSVLGSPSYMAPEQAGGKTKEVGPAADVYALGAILYELLTGRPPFRGATMLETLEQVKTTDAVPPSRLVPGLPRDAETIALKCLQKDPSRRYESAAALAEDLRRYQAGEPIVARPVGSAERAWRWCRRNPVVAGLTAAVAMLLVAATAGAGAAAVYYGLAARRAERLRIASEELARTEARAKNELEATLYFQRIALAHRELLENNLLQAEELLDQCPDDRRAWEWYCLKRLCHVEPVTVRGLRGLSAFSPEGRRLASCVDDQTVKIWDTATGQELLTLPTAGELRCVAFRPPDGRQLVTGDTSGAVTFWDTTTRQVIRTFRPRAAPVNGLAFSPDGRYFASAGWTTVPVWDATNGDLVHELRGHERDVATVAFSPNGRRIASGSFDRTVKIWDMSSGQPIQTLRGHEGPVTSLAFSPDGGRLASTSRVDPTRTVRVWDLATGLGILTFAEHTQEPTSVVFLDGRRLASAGVDKTVKIWDATTRQVVLTLRGDDEVDGLACSPDGRRLASTSVDKTVKIWDATPMDAKAGQGVLTLRGHTDQVWDIVFSPDGRRLASASWDRTVRVWDAQTGREILLYRNHILPVFCLAFSLDGRRIASGGVQPEVNKPGYLQVWDAPTGQEVLHPRRKTALAYSVAFSPGNGRWLVAGAEGSAVMVWDATTGELAHTLGSLSDLSRGVWGLAFRPDGRRLATLSRQGSVAVYDATRWGVGAPLIFRAHKESVRGRLAFSPDGRRLVVPGDENVVNIWDVTCTDKPPTAPRLTLRGHTAQVWGVDVSPDGRWIASGGEDNTVKLWDAEAGGEPLHTFRGHGSVVSRVTFSPAGRRLASASFDKTVKVWDLTRMDTKRMD